MSDLYTEQHGLLAGRFEVIERVAAGGMGTVYRGLDRLRGEPVALKIVQPKGREAAIRLLEEAAILARLDHPAIVRYVAHGPADGDDLYLAMEWLSGEDLSARLARGALSVAEAVTLGLRVAEALGAAHANGVVHRDLKPSNVFLPGGDVAQAKVLDFGIARRRGNRPLTRTGFAMGTPGYMAPEQVSGDAPVDARTDVFALGCVLYEALSGRPAFVSDSVVGLLAKTLVDDPPLVGELCAGAKGPLESLVACMLAKSPAERPSNGDAAARMLASVPVAGDEAKAAAPARTEALTDEERWLVSVILAGTSDPALEDTLLREVTPAEEQALSRVREAVGPFLGRAELLADGAIVVTLLGIGTATDQAAHAARAAAAIRAVVPEMRLSLATGHSAGLVAAGATSEAIDRAAALLRRASPGEVTIDDLTAGLVDGRFEIDREGATPRLGAERESQDGPRTLLGKLVPCVGRDREIGALLGIWDECVEERVARAVLLTAGPGMGKSRLRHEVEKRIRGRSPDVRVLACQGDPVTASAPYSLLGPALRRVMGVAHGEPEATAQSKVRAAARAVAASERERVASLLGELVGVPFPEADHPWLVAARSDSIVHADQVRRAWEDFVQAEGARAPWLFVVEDLHWGDPPSVRLIEAALRHAKETPLFALALARPEVDAVFPDLWAGRGITRMELSSLSKRAGARLAREALGASLSERDIDEIVEQSEGNALYLEELIRAAAGPVDEDTASFEEPSPLSSQGRRARAPTTVMAMMQSRIEALPAPERRALRAGSVLGNSFWLEAVERMLGGAEPIQRLDATLRRLVEEEVLVRSEHSRLSGKRQYTFRHALLREAAYNMLTEEDRALGHRLAAGFLEGAGEAEAAVIAEHHRRGAELSRAAFWYRRAAEQALDANDLAGAIERGVRAVACGAKGEELGLVRLRQAEAYSWLGDAGRTETHAIEATRLLAKGSGPWATALAHAATASQRLGRTERAVELARQLLAAAAGGRSPDAAAAAGGRSPDAAAAAGGRSPDAARAGSASNPEVSGAQASMGLRALLISTARVAGNLCNAGHTDLGAEMLAAVESARAAEGLGEDPMLRARILAAEGQLRMSQGAPDRAAEATRASSEEFVRAGDLRAAWTVRVNAGFSLMLLGAWGEADSALSAILPEAERMNLGAVVAAAKQNLGLVRALRGGRAEGLALEQEAIELYRGRGDLRMESACQTYVAMIQEMGGELESALDHAAQGAALAEPRSGERALALAVRARVLLRMDRPGEALIAATEAHARSTEGLLQEGEVLVRLAYAEALHASGDMESARAEIVSLRGFVEAQAAAIGMPERRRSLLEEVPENARTMALATAWAEGLTGE